MILPLQLRHDQDAGGSAEAWFLPGPAPAHWLETLTRAGLADADTRLFVVPKSSRHPAAAGILAVPGSPKDVRQKQAGIPCRLIAGRLFVPLDAQLHPRVTDEEVRALCALPVSFYHPAFGLSGFESESAWRVWDLLDAPIEREDNWNSARPGVPRLPELTGITLAQPPSPEDIFGGAEKDIGSEGPKDLPPAPDEPKEGALSNTGRDLRRLFAKGLANVLRIVPHTGSNRTWVNDAEDWALRQLNAANDQLERLRNKELHRLLHLLATDPEAGLRHAIPMNNFAHRGIAPPGGRLGPRPLSFDPARIGGGPADFWNVPADLQNILRQRYREMADREMQLGRYRRAAYIYAELLGDLVAAANTLKQGGHFREAALLYEEHLKNPLEAARCLTEGGLLLEAIERFEKLKRWLDVAELQERLGNHREAEAAVRRVVEERLSGDDIVGAAQLVDERLRQPDEALGMLLSAWPASRQAAACVSAALKLLARLGRHEVALERLAHFRRESLPPKMVLPLLNALGGPALDYPHDTVRHRAADLSRVLIARQLTLPSLPSDEAGQLLRCLQRLAPEDRLLARDTNRHLAGLRTAETRVRRVTPAPARGSKPEVVRRFNLPRPFEWLQFRSEWHWFYAVGVSKNRLTLVRGNWDGVVQGVSWDCHVQLVRDGLVFEPTRERGASVVIGVVHFPQKKMPATDTFFGQECLVGTPAWLPPQGLSFTFGEESCWSGHVAAGRAVLTCHDKVGRLQQSVDVTEELLSGTKGENGARLCLQAVGTGVAVALGNRLVLVRADGSTRLTRVELSGQVVGLIATLPHTRQGIVALLAHGAVLCWLGTESVIELDRDFAPLSGAFVPGGPLVLVSGTQMILLEVDSKGVHKVARMELPHRVAGVVATASPGQFATLDTRGEVTVYRAGQ